MQAILQFVDPPLSLKSCRTHKLRSQALSLLGNFKFGTVKVLKLRPTNNDAGSHAVKL